MKEIDRIKKKERRKRKRKENGGYIPIFRIN